MLEGSVELICASVTMLPERAQFGTFLPPIQLRHDVIYIPNIDSAEYLDWNVFMSPFSTEMWIALIMKCIIFSAFAYIIEWFHSYQLVRLCNFRHKLHNMYLKIHSLLRFRILYSTNFGLHLYQILVEHHFNLKQIIFHPTKH